MKLSKVTTDEPLASIEGPVWKLLMEVELKSSTLWNRGNQLAYAMVGTSTFDRVNDSSPLRLSQQSGFRRTLQICDCTAVLLGYGHKVALTSLIGSWLAQILCSLSESIPQ